jgi:hypothetical protein
MIIGAIYNHRISGIIVYAVIFCCLYIAAFIYLKKEIFEQIIAIENTKRIENVNKLISNIGAKSPKTWLTAEKVKISIELSAIIMGVRSREVRTIILGFPPKKPKTNYLSADNYLTIVGKGGQILVRLIPDELANRIRSVAIEE